MATTSHLNLTLLEQSQAQKEVTVNAALAAIDAVLNTGATDKDLATPPGSPSEGDVYIVGSSATGDWASHDNDIAYYLNSAWAFITPNEGMVLWVNDENMLYVWDGSSWVVSTNTQQNISLLGVNTTADSTNKLSVASDAVLFSNNGADSQVKINKNADTDTASFLFQTNFSGRAEFGTIGDDHFQLKVSDNGSNFHQSWVITNNTGDVNFKKIVHFEDHITLQDGITAPSSSAGQAKLFVDSADGDLKVIFGDGTTKTIVTDS